MTPDSCDQKPSFWETLGVGGWGGGSGLVGWGVLVNQYSSSAMQARVAATDQYNKKLEISLHHLLGNFQDFWVKKEILGTRQLLISKVKQRILCMIHYA